MEKQLVYGAFLALAIIWLGAYLFQLIPLCSGSIFGEWWEFPRAITYACILAYFVVIVPSKIIK